MCRRPALRGSLLAALLTATARADYIQISVLSGAACTSSPAYSQVIGASTCSSPSTGVSQRIQCINASAASVVLYNTSSTCTGTPYSVQPFSVGQPWGCTPGSPTTNVTCVSASAPYTPPPANVVQSGGNGPTCPVTNPFFVVSYTVDTCVRVNATASGKVSCLTTPGLVTVSTWGYNTCV